MNSETYRGIEIVTDGWGVRAVSINCFTTSIQSCKARIDQLHADYATCGLMLVTTNEK